MAAIVDKDLALHHPDLSAKVHVMADLNARLVYIDIGEGASASGGRDDYHVLQGLIDTSVAEEVEERFHYWQRWGATGSRGGHDIDGPMTEADLREKLGAKFKELTGKELGEIKPGDEVVEGKFWFQPTTASDAKALWQYRVDDGVDGKIPGWYPYEPEANSEVEEIYSQHVANQRNQRTSIRIVSSGYFSYKVDLAKMTQTNTKTKKARQIRRAVGDEEAGFEPAPGFLGLKPGKVFRLGALGLGYYKDTGAPPSFGLPTEALAMPPSSMFAKPAPTSLTAPGLLPALSMPSFSSPALKIKPGAPKAMKKKLAVMKKTKSTKKVKAMKPKADLMMPMAEVKAVVNDAKKKARKEAQGRAKAKMLALRKQIRNLKAEIKKTIKANEAEAKAEAADSKKKAKANVAESKKKAKAASKVAVTTAKQRIVRRLATKRDPISWIFKGVELPAGGKFVKNTKGKVCRLSLHQSGKKSGWAQAISQATAELGSGKGWEKGGALHTRARQIYEASKKAACESTAEETCESMAEATCESMAEET